MTYYERNKMIHHTLLFKKRFPVNYKIKTLLLLAILILISPITGNPNTKKDLTNSPTQLFTFTGKNLNNCKRLLRSVDGGWCEIRNGNNYSISSAWPKNLSKKIRMKTGPSSVLHAWNSAAFDSLSYKLYFIGGGHTDYGGNEVYEFDLTRGKWSRLTNPSPLYSLYSITYTKKNSTDIITKFCWTTDITNAPASTHTYDGLIFSHVTNTLFLYVMGAANGSCFNKSENSGNQGKLIGTRTDTIGWYEFNPDKEHFRNDIPPLSWRRVFEPPILINNNIHQGYPVSAEKDNGQIIFGSKYRTTIFSPSKGKINGKKNFTKQPDYGDGVAIFDKKRNIFWSLHKNVLLGYNGSNGKLIRKIETPIPHEKSLAIDKHGRLFSWNGKRKVFFIDPDTSNKWEYIDWKEKGPYSGMGRVYGKWVYLKRDNLFVGISTHKTGIWIYKHPANPANTPSSTYPIFDPQKAINLATPGEKIKIPPGTYPFGLFINKSLQLDLSGVKLTGIAKNKGTVNIHCNNCSVTIKNFKTDGRQTGCYSGNCAGIKIEGINFRVTIDTSHIKNTGMGILTDNRGGILNVKNTTIENIGSNSDSDTLSHGIYAGNIHKLEILNSKILNIQKNGHLVKTRAMKTIIYRSTIAGMSGYHSRTIDQPCGGELIVEGSILQHGENSDNIDIIGIGTEEKNCGENFFPPKVILKNNMIIIDRDRSPDERSANEGKTRLFTWTQNNKNFQIENNIFIGPTNTAIININHPPISSIINNKFFSSRESAGIGDGIPEKYITNQ